MYGCRQNMAVRKHGNVDSETAFGEDMYGYEMIDTLRKRSQNVFELKAGTLYPLLHGLEEKHYLTSYEQEVPGKVRKYYRITREGKDYLEKKKAEWKEYSQAVTDVLALEVFG